MARVRNYHCPSFSIKMLLQLAILPTVLVTAKLPANSLLHNSTNKPIVTTRASPIHVTDTFGDPFGMAPLMVKMMGHLAQTNFPLKADYPLTNRLNRLEHHARIRKPPKNASLPIIPKDPVFSMDMFPGLVDDFMVRTIFDTIDESLSRENGRSDFLPIDILDTNPDNPVSFSPVYNKLPEKRRPSMSVTPYRDERPGAIHKFIERAYSNDRAYVNHHNTIPPLTPPSRNETIVNGTLRNGTINNGTIKNGTMNYSKMNGTSNNGTINNKTMINVAKTTIKNTTHHKNDTHGHHRVKRCKFHPLTNGNLFNNVEISGDSEDSSSSVGQNGKSYDDPNESMVSISFARSPDFILNSPFHSPFRPLSNSNLFPGLENLLMPDLIERNEIFGGGSNDTVISTNFNVSETNDSSVPTFKIRAFRFGSGSPPNVPEFPRIMLYRWGFGLNHRSEPSSSISKVTLSSEDYDVDSVDSTNSSISCRIGSSDFFVKVLSVYKCGALVYIFFCISVLVSAFIILRTKKCENQRKGSIIRV